VPTASAVFDRAEKPLKTVLRPAQHTPPKQGVNDKMRSDNHFVCKIFRLDPREPAVHEGIRR